MVKVGDDLAAWTLTGIASLVKLIGKTTSRNEDAAAVCNGVTPSAEDYGAVTDGA